MVQDIFFVSHETTSTEIDPGITRQVMGRSEAITLAKVHFESGAQAGMHSHPDNDQSSYVAQGRFEITIGSECMILGPGDGFFVAKGVMHDARCMEDGILIDTFSPGRADMK